MHGTQIDEIITATQILESANQFVDERELNIAYLDSLIGESRYKKTNISDHLEKVKEEEEFVEETMRTLLEVIEILEDHPKMEIIKKLNKLQDHYAAVLSNLSETKKYDNEILEDMEFTIDENHKKKIALEREYEKEKPTSQKATPELIRKKKDSLISILNLSGEIAKHIKAEKKYSSFVSLSVSELRNSTDAINKENLQGEKASPQQQVVPADRSRLIDLTDTINKENLQDGKVARQQQVIPIDRSEPRNIFEARPKTFAAIMSTAATASTLAAACVLVPVVIGALALTGAGALVVTIGLPVLCGLVGAALIGAAGYGIYKLATKRKDAFLFGNQENDNSNKSSTVTSNLSLAS